MNRKEHLLLIVSEECNETAQRISKGLRFGVTEVQPGQLLDNADRLLGEYYDLVAAMEMLYEGGIIKNWSPERQEMHKAAKKMQVEKFLLHSKNNGTLEEKPYDYDKQI
jgi:hypothetical protein